MQRIKWNKGWRVWRERSAFNLVFAVPEDALTVDLPYDAAFHTEQDPACPSAGSTGFIRGGVFNYYKELLLAPEDAGGEFLLEIEGAMSRCTVYVNGSAAGSSSYGYAGFCVDLTPYLRAGANRILAVCATDDCSSRYYAGCGLYRDVWLLRGGGVAVENGSLWVRTLRADGESAVVEVSASVRNAALAPRDVRIRFTACSEKGDTVLSAEYPVLIPGGGSASVRRTFTIDAPALWSEDSPNLYAFAVCALDGDGELDRESVLTGIRTLTVDAKHGMRVNGVPVKLRGACIHRDQGLLGAATYDEYEYRRVKRLKEAGFNAVRCAHDPAGSALLRACDRLGVYVMDEAFDMWARMKNPADHAQFFDRDREDVVRAMVQTDRNHPSVVLYSTGNEISEIGTEGAYALSRKMCALFHELDLDRFTTNGINGAFAAGNGLIEIASSLTGRDESEFADGDINKFMGLVATAMDRIVQHKVVGDILERMDSTNDVMGYNYMTSRYRMDHEAYPQRVMVGTETYPRQIAENWAVIRDCPAVLGDFTWTGADYMGETGGPDRFPQLVNPAGDVDFIGERRPVSYYREIVFGLTDRPRINVRPPECFGKPRMFGPWKFTDGIRCWTFPGQEGAMVTVEVFAGGEEAELYLNGELLGRKKVGEETGCYVSFDLPYAPGTLRAVSLRGGVPAGEDTLSTSSSYRLAAWAEDYRSLPESGGLVFVNAAVVDDRGERAVRSDARLRIETEGARLVAFGSIASPHAGGYTAPVTPVGEGGALAVLKPEGPWRAAVSCEEMGRIELRGN